MNEGIHRLSQEQRLLVEKELDPGERVMWSVQPLRGAFVKRTIPFVFFGLVWLGILSTFVFDTLGTPENTGSADWGTKLFMIPFILVGLGMLMAPFWAMKNAKQTVYIITDRRALTVHKIAGNNVIKSYLPNQLQNLTRVQRSDGSGDIIFGSETIYIKRQARQRSFGFKGVPQVKQVEDLLETLASASLSQR